MLIWNPHHALRAGRRGACCFGLALAGLAATAQTAPLSFEQARTLALHEIRRWQPAPPKPTHTASGDQIAASSVSPVRMRTTCSMGRTKIFPSPILPV